MKNLDGKKILIWVVFPALCWCVVIAFALLICGD